MSENLRMVGIVALFLVAGGLMWSMLSGSGVEEELSEGVTAPLIDRSDGVLPEFEFEDVGDGVSEIIVAEVAVETGVEESGVGRFGGKGRISGVISMGLGGAVPPDSLVTLHFVPDEVLVDSSVDTIVEVEDVTVEGRYEFENLGLGRYTVFANSDRYAGTGSATLTVSRPRVVRDFDLHVAGEMSGFVRNANGEGIGEAHVYLAGYMSRGQYQKVDAGRSRASQVAVGEDGSFRIGNIHERSPSVPYRLIATASGYAAGVTDLITVNSSGVAIILGRGSDISGVVVDGITREPVAGAELAFESGDAVGMRVVTTDGDGAFALASVGAGNHIVSLLDDLLVVSKATAEVRVIEGESIDELVIEVLRGAGISGRVFDSDTGAGVSGVRMAANPADQRLAKLETATTDASGKYSMKGLRGGSYRVMYNEIEGYSSRKRYDEQRNIVTAIGKTRAGVDFSVSAGLRISGIVLDLENRPVADARVTGQLMREELEPGQETTWDSTNSDVDGRFVLAGFRANAEISISFSKNGLGRSTASVELGPESLTGVRLEFGAGSTISGFVVDAGGNPASGANVRATHTTTGSSDYASIGDGGRFSIAGLAAGSYMLKIDNGSSLATITVAEGEHKRDVRLVWDVTVGDLVTSGRVVDDLGNAIEGVRVSSYQQSSGSNRNSLTSRATTNVDGEYSVSRVATGSHRISASRMGYRPDSVNVAAGSLGADIVLERTGRVSGRVLDSGTGEPVTAFTMLLLNGNSTYRASLERNFKSYHSDDGSFVIGEVFAGSSNLIFRAPGRAEITFPVSGLMPGESREGVEVRLDAGLTLTGVVRNTAGDVIQGASIFLGNMPTQNWERDRAKRDTTDVMGRYSLDSLSSEEVLVSAYAPGFLVNSTSVVVGNSGGRLDFVLDQGAVIEGRVYLDGVGQSGVSVEVELTSSGGVGDRSARTDAEGFYQISGLPSGSAGMEASLTVGSSRPSKLVIVEVESGMVTDYDFEFVTSRSSVEGYIKIGDRPTAGRVQLMASRDGTIEQRNAEAGADGHYIFENVPAGTVKITARVSNPDSTNTATAELGVDEVLRLDVSLGGGVTIVCTLSGVPEGYRSAGVIALPPNYDVPESLTMNNFFSLFQNIVREPAAVEGRVSELRSMEAGDYTLLGLAMIETDAGEPDFESMLIVSSTVHVVGDADMSVFMSFND